MSSLREIFESKDSDNSGSIEVAELEGVLVELGVNAGGDAALVALAKLDSAAPDRVTFEELDAWWNAVKGDLAKPEADPRLRGLFDRFDKDGSGTIDVTELEALLGAAKVPIKRDAILAAIMSVDSDGSGTFSFDEFTAWWTALHRITDQGQ